MKPDFRQNVPIIFCTQLLVLQKMFMGVLPECVPVLGAGDDERERVRSLELELRM